MTSKPFPAADVAIAGGGIAGMAAALAFARSGREVDLFEQAAAFREVGAGLQISPNGANVLRALGLEGEASRRGIAAQAVAPMDALSGREIGRFDLTTRKGAPYRFFHRADLLDMLAGAAEAAGARLHTLARVTEVTEAGLRFADGTAQRAPLVVGADGLHSRLRAALLPDSTPFFTGQTAWRAVVAGDHPPVSRIWMAPGRHVVTYPLPNGRINIVAVRETRDWAAEGWAVPDDPANLLRAFADVAPDLRAILAKVEELHLWGLFRHPLAARWHGAHTALIGDAAHPTLPFLGQGANLALEDAYVLAALTQSPLETALPAYQQARHARVARAIATANANAANYHLSGVKRQIAHAGLRAIATFTPAAFLGRLSWLYDHDVTQAYPLRG